MSNDAASRKYKFYVDAEQFETNETSLTGLQIKEQAHVTPTYQLFLEEEGDIPDRAIADTEHVSMDGKKSISLLCPSGLWVA